jgi:hypothetical protein
MYRPELCARPGVSTFVSPPVPLPPVTLGSLGAHAPAIGYPMTPHVCPWASALGLWGTGNRVRISPITGGGEDGVDTTPSPIPLSEHAAEASQPRPVRVAQPSIPRVPPRYVWIGIERQPLSHRAPR